ncbi:hypothetical protein Bbelb_433210 [Branchiostoma belcheri]|nr:hypothetical protein Bbelb_433210 [Branchiostoma belcheri]
MEGWGSQASVMVACLQPTVDVKQTSRHQGNVDILSSPRRLGFLWWKLTINVKKTFALHILPMSLFTSVAIEVNHRCRSIRNSPENDASKNSAYTKNVLCNMTVLIADRTSNRRPGKDSVPSGAL